MLNPDLSPKQLEGKDIILDVHVKDDTGKEYDFEMQMGGEYVSEHKRFEYYGAKMLTYQLNKGEQYESLKEVYQIIFIDAYAKTNRNLINAYQMRTNKGEEEYEGGLIRRIYIHLPAINKVKKQRVEKGMNAFEQICYLFKNGESDAILKTKESVVKKLMGKYREMQENKPLWTFAEQIEQGKMRIENMQRDKYQQGIKEGLEVGKQQGIEVGKQQGIDIGYMNMIDHIIKEKYQVDETIWLSTLTQQQMMQLSTLLIKEMPLDKIKRMIHHEGILEHNSKYD